MVCDTLINRTGISGRKLPRVNRTIEQAQRDYDAFNKLTDRVLAQPRSGRGLWSHFKSDSPDEALWSDMKVFLAGALEATTSYVNWAIPHLSRNVDAQERSLARRATSRSTRPRI